MYEITEINNEPGTSWEIVDGVLTIRGQDVYPHKDGDYLVLGPEIFTDGTVICWQGANFTKQPESDIVPLLDGDLNPL